MNYYTQDAQTTSDAQDRYNKKAGEVIKQLRKQKGLSQGELVKSDNPSESICSVKTLRRIEQGKTAPSIYELKRILVGLGVSIAEFEALVDGQDMLVFQNDFEEITELFFDKQFEEADKRLKLLKSQKYCDTNNPIIAQALLLGDGLQKYFYNDKNGALETYYVALCITAPSVVQEIRELKCKSIVNNTFALNEYRLINGILGIIWMQGGGEQLNFAIEVYNITKKSILSSTVDSNTRCKLLPIIYYNLSECLIKGGYFKEGLTIVEEGIKFCRRVNTFRIFGYLLYNRARAQYWLGDKEDAIKGFKHAYDTFISFNHIKLAERTKKSVAEKYQIYV